MQRVAIYAATGVVIALMVVWQVYPIYPSTNSLCALHTVRSELEAYWNVPGKGAVIRVEGNLRGGSPEFHLIECACGAATNVYAMIEVLPSTVVSPATRRALDEVDRRSDRDRSAEVPVTALVRVKEVGTGGCFGPGVVLTALSIESRGSVRVAKLR